MMATQEQILADVSKLLEPSSVPSGIAYYDERWRAFANALESDLVQVTDWLSALKAEQFAKFLPRAGKAASAGLVGKDCLAAWMHDSYAAAWAELYGLLSRLPVRDRHTLLAGKGEDPLWEALHTVLGRLAAIRGLGSDPQPANSMSRSQESHKIRMSSRDVQMLTKRLVVWRHTRQEVALPTEEARLLALALVELEEEFSWRRVWGVTAGEDGGIIQIEVAGLRPIRKRLPRCELALWSRHVPSATDWHDLEQVLVQIGGRLPDMEGASFRIAFNPPNRVPAGPQHVTARALEGGSLGLGLILAAYAMQEGMRLHKVAATGQVDGDRIKPVEGVAEKIRRLHAYNAEARPMGRQPITHLLVPNDNLAEANSVNEVSGEPLLQLRINEGLRGRQFAVRKVGDLMQPGILCDGLEGYCRQILEAVQPLKTLEPESQEDLDHARPMVEAALAGLEAGEKGHIVPVPHREAGDESVTSEAVRLLARECAQRRMNWVERWFQGEVTAKTRSGVPIVVLENLPEHPPEDFESRAVREVVKASVTLTEQDLREGWRSLENEFTLILRGNDDLIRHHIVGDGGLLAQIGGEGPNAGRHAVVLVSNGVHQMEEWADDLDTVRD